ncbi:13208_t:CDS:2, partial [Acaulospora morrowiae]
CVDGCPSVCNPSDHPHFEVRAKNVRFSSPVISFTERCDCSKGEVSFPRPLSPLTSFYLLIEITGPTIVKTPSKDNSPHTGWLLTVRLQTQPIR